MPTGSGKPGGVSTDYSIERASDEATRSEIKAIKERLQPVTVRPLQLPEPSGTWPIAYRPKKNDVFDTLRCAIDPNTVKLKLVLEHYTESGGVVTVLETIRDSIEITPDMISVSGGVTLVEFEFPKKLEVNALYGLIRLFAFPDSGGRIENPPKDPPASSGRVTSDYLKTWDSTNGNKVVTQGSAPGNILKNGWFAYSDDAPAATTQLRKWTAATSGAAISTGTGADSYWDDAKARGVIQKANEGFQQGIGKRVRRGEIINISMDLLGSSAFSGEVDIDIQTGGGVSVINTLGKITIDLTTTIARANAPMQIKDTADLSGNLRCFVTSPTTLNNNGGGGTGRTIGLTNVMLSHGLDPQPFDLAKDDIGRSGTNSFDPTITVIMVNADIGQNAPLFEYGSGGIILPQ